MDKSYVNYCATDVVNALACTYPDQSVEQAIERLATALGHSMPNGLSADGKHRFMLALLAKALTNGD
jgi:hypothetical protein